MPLNVDELKAKVLSLAVKGKLVDSSIYTSESGDELVERIKSERESYVGAGRKSSSITSIINLSDQAPFELPINWTWAYLSDISLITMGQSPEGESVTNDEKSGIEFHQGKADFGEMYIKQSGKFTSSPNKLAKKDSILISMRAPVGTLNFTDREISIGRGLAAIEPYQGISKKYIFYAISALENSLREQSTGTTIEAITGRILSTMLIPIPSVEEQIAIVVRIEELFGIIDNLSSEADSQLETLDQLRQKTLDLAIRGKLVPQDENDEPSSELLKRIQSEKDRLIKEKKIKRPAELKLISDDEIPFEIPESWEWVRLGNYVYNSGQKKPDKLFSYIDVSAIDNKSGKIKGDFEILKPKCAPSRARKIVNKGSIVYSTVRPYLLNIAIVDIDFEYEPIVSTAFSVMDLFCQCSNDYLYNYLRSKLFVEYVENKMVGQAYPAINDENLMNGLVPVPPLNEQFRIADKIKNILFLINTLESEIKRNINFVI